MRRPFLIAILALGTVVGYGSGFARMRANRGGCHRQGGWSQRWDGNRYGAVQAVQGPAEQKAASAEATALKAQATAAEAKTAAEEARATAEEAVVRVEKVEQVGRAQGSEPAALAQIQTIAQLQGTMQAQAQQLAQAQVQAQVAQQQLLQAQAQLAALTQQLVQLKAEKKE